MDVQKYLRRKGVSKLTNDNLQVGVSVLALSLTPTHCYIMWTHNVGSYLKCSN